MRPSNIVAMTSLLLATSACAATTTGPGVYSPECLPSSYRAELADGQYLNLGVKDMSFGSDGEGDFQDHVSISLEGSRLVLDGQYDDTEASINGSTLLVDDPVSIQLSSEPVEGTLTEDGITMTMSAVLNENDLAVVSLAWACGDGGGVPSTEG